VPAWAMQPYSAHRGQRPTGAALGALLLALAARAGSGGDALPPAARWPSGGSAALRGGVGTSWVQVYAAPGDGAQAAPGTRGVTGIFVAASFLPVCSAGSDGAHMGVTANNICIGGAHWGAPFLPLRGGAQGVGGAWRKREVGQAKTKRQARVERGKKLSAVMGGKERRGRHRKKVPLEHQPFKSEWHRQKALKQAERRLARKMARKQANSTSAGPPTSHQNAVFPGRESLERVGAASEAAATESRAYGDAVRGSAVQDGQGESESVPESFLAEMERMEQQGKATGTASAASSDLPPVVLDSAGNEVPLDVPLQYMPGDGAGRGAEDNLEAFAQSADVRPYTDAEGNVRWVDRRSQLEREQCLRATLSHLRGPLPQSADTEATRVERLRGGGPGVPHPPPPAPTRAGAWPERGAALACFGGPGAACSRDQEHGQRRLEQERMLRLARAQVAALEKQVCVPLLPACRASCSCCPPALAFALRCQGGLPCLASKRSSPLQPSAPVMALHAARTTHLLRVGGRDKQVRLVRQRVEVRRLERRLRLRRLQVSLALARSIYQHAGH